MAAKSISGFPEWLPTGRQVERHVLDTLQRVFELHSYQEIQTRAVEPLSELLRKGETSKEVYTLRRLQEDTGSQVASQPRSPANQTQADPSLDQPSADKDALALHFDLTVPLARYVLQHQNDLAFPFKRYQIQPVWRGERPQAGRFREFIQADIDVIGRNPLPFHYEVELPLMVAKALTALGLDIQVLVNNRKISQGFYSGLGLPDIDAVLREIDKLDKIGPAAVGESLVKLGASTSQANACLELASISADAGPTVTEQVTSLAGQVGISGEAATLLEQGLAELSQLLDATNTALPGTFRAELKIARGLDYYTGSVYETTWVGHQDLGSICSGGRYDSLAKDNRATYPGVGLSVGVSRLVSRLIAQDLMRPSRQVPAACLVLVNSEAERPASDIIAAQLRQRGVPCDVAPTAAKFGKQIAYADKRGIPWVVFSDGQVKDLRSGEQAQVELATWAPPSQDLSPTMTGLN
ncbi:MAG: histidine--tRNA ligase [Micrococcales bacterium]|nr:histidine--tRNA ligase [Micrococcales bacterium]